MKITLLVVGKTDASYLQDGISEYYKRLKHYINFDLEIIPDIKKGKNTSIEIQKKKEGEIILSKLGPGKEMHLFDEKGKMFTSLDFSKFIEQKMVSGPKELVFVIGGPYGFAPEVYQKATSKISMSRFTFSHQMVRLLCIEQIYRAFTIMKGEPYHHE